MALSRGKVTDNVFDREGGAVSGASIRVYSYGTTTPVNVYAAKSGGSPLSQPLSTDANGMFTFWASPVIVDVAISGVPGKAPETRTMLVPADPTEQAEASGGTLTNPSISGGSITGATLSNPTITGATSNGGSISGAAITGGSVTSLLYDKGGYVVNVKAYGAGPALVGTNEPDLTDSTAIEAAFDDAEALAVAMKTSSGDGRIIGVKLPAGKYNLARPILPPLVSGLTIEGDGMESTVLDITQSAGDSAATWAGHGLLYIVGHNFLTLRNLSIHLNNSNPAVTTHKIPQVGIVVAGNAAGSTNIFGDALPANVTNQIKFENVRVQGAFLKACLANVANVSSEFHNLELTRNKSYNPTYPNGVDMNEAALVLSAHNTLGISNPPSGPAIVAAASGAQCSDLKFTGGEIHDAVGINAVESPPGTWTENPVACACPAVLIEETYAAHLTMRNWSSRGPAYAILRPGLQAVGNLYGPRGILLEVTQMYEGDNVPATEAPEYAVLLTGNQLDNAAVDRTRILNDSGAAATFAIVASDLVIRNSHIKVQSNGAVLGGRRYDNGAGTATYVRPRVENVQLQNASTGAVNVDYLVKMEGSAQGNLIDAVLDCSGLKLDLNGAQPRRGTLYRPGTITHGPGTAIIEHGSTGVQEYGNAQYLAWRNAANSGTYQVLGLDGSNVVQIGDANVTGINANKPVTLPTLSGTPVQNGLYATGFIKGWAYINGTTGALVAGHNVSSTSRVVQGQFRVNWDRDFANTSYAVVAMAHFNSSGTTATSLNAQEQISGRQVGLCDIVVTRASDGALTDPTNLTVIAFGTQ